MKILYDYQIFEDQNFGGISRYFFELMNGFRNSEEIEYELGISYSNNEYLKADETFKNNIQPKPVYKSILQSKNEVNPSFFWKIMLRIERYIRNSIKPDITSIQNREATIKLLKEGNFDVFHPTYYNDYFLEYIGDKPYVLTVYDLIHEVFPEFMMFQANKTERLLSNAAKIIAISHSTKKDLVSLYNVDESKVEVVHLASSFNTGNNTGVLLDGLPEQYLLFVGNRGSYKNFYFFAEVFKKVSKKYSNLFIVCTGNAFAAQEIRYFDTLGISKKVLHYYANDNELITLYKNALAFVFPSQYEGFGLPLLEAFACECPVICSNGSSLSEIAGNAAIYFDAKNPSTLLNAISQLLESQDLRIQLKQKGLLQFNQYSWEKTVQATKMVYQSIL